MDFVDLSQFIKKDLYKARLRFIYKSNYPKMQSSWTLIEKIAK